MTNTWRLVKESQLHWAAQMLLPTVSAQMASGIGHGLLSKHVLIARHNHQTWQNMIWILLPTCNSAGIDTSKHRSLDAASRLKDTREGPILDCRDMSLCVCVCVCLFKQALGQCQNMPEGIRHILPVLLYMHRLLALAGNLVHLGSVLILAELSAGPGG